MPPLFCRHAGSRPLPISVPLPDIVIAPALVPCPSASALACRHCRRRLKSLAHQRPPSPAIVVAAAATGGGGRARQIITVRRCPRRPAPALAVPSTSVVQRRHNHCRHQAVFAGAASNLVLFGQRTFSHKEESFRSKSKAKECNLYVYIFRFRFLSIDHYREERWDQVQG